MRFRHLPEAVASMVVTLIFLLFFGSILKRCLKVMMKSFSFGYQAFFLPSFGK